MFRVSKKAEDRHAYVTNLTVELLDDLESFRSEGQRAGRVRELSFERFGDLFICLYHLRHSKIYPVIIYKLGYGSFGTNQVPFILTM